MRRIRAALRQIQRRFLAGLRSVDPSRPQNILGRIGMTVSTILLLVLIVLLLKGFGEQVIRSAGLESRRVALATEVTLLESENRRLTGIVEYAESDANVERIAREQLGFARDGDVVIVSAIQSPTPTPAPAPADAVPAPLSTPNWEGWWRALFPRE